MYNLISAVQSSLVKNKYPFPLRYLLLMLLLYSPCFGQSISNHLPATVDTSKNYLFYLHGRIIEEQGVRPTSEKYGTYEYGKILQTFADSGFVVISDARKKNTRPANYAKKVATQVDSLIQYGVNPSRITVVGASKGAAITVLISSLLKNRNLNFVIMAICNKYMAGYWRKNNVHFWGRVLYIYDSSDIIAGSCGGYMKLLKSPGLTEFKELELKLGLGHGMLFRPLKEWVGPAVRWANL